MPPSEPVAIIVDDRANRRGVGRVDMALRLASRLAENGGGGRDG
jgi:hypothetical protein